MPDPDPDDEFLEDDESAATPALPPSPLELEGSGLRIEGDELVRRTATGAITMRFLLNEVYLPAFGWSVSWIAIVILLACVGLAALGYYVVESPTFAIILYLISLVGVACCLAGIIQYELRFMVGGVWIRVNCSDAADDIHGFANSLKVRTGAFAIQANPGEPR